MNIRDITQAFKIADTQKCALVKVRFGSIEARTAFYRARTKLGPNTDIWINEDLTRGNEVLAYQARKLCFHKFFYRTWTYMGHVFMQKTEDARAEKVTKKEELPGYEHLDRLSIPKQNTGRFQAVPAREDASGLHPVPPESLRPTSPYRPTSSASADTTHPPVPDVELASAVTSRAEAATANTKVDTNPQITVTLDTTPNKV